MPMATAAQESYEFFLRADLSRHVGDWVAILKDRIVAHGRSIKEVYRHATKEHAAKDILFVKVPGKNAMILNCNVEGTGGKALRILRQGSA